jgi:hypothetical protein
MDEERFNMSLRRFLKEVGVTSQRAIEDAVRAAQADGRLAKDTVDATMTLTIPGLDLTHVVTGRIELA